MKDFKVSAIICAAGKGARAGFSCNKLLAPLYGAPVIYHTLKKFDNPYIDEVIVTFSAEDKEQISALCAPFGYKTVLGGTTRTQSVKNALKAVTGDIVLIHDGARPFVDESLITGCIDSVKKFSSGICAIPVTDTVAQAEYGEITGGLDRNTLYRIQTPQGFFTEDIRRAYRLAGDKEYTDDSSVYCEFIAPPRLTEGSEQNIKLTYAVDFKREVCSPLSADGGLREGFGVDVHAFGEGDGITLAGIKIPHDRKLIAHSDGDVLIHAVMDALLSAAGLKDIGHYFPDNDPSYSGADSAKLLEEVVRLIKKEGLKPLNVSASVQAEKPRLSPYIEQMIENLAEILKLPAKAVAVSAGTCEGLGFVGEGLGIAAYCTALLTKDN